MTQSRLNRAVARATGESLATIERLGFSIVDPELVDFDPDPPVPGIAALPGAESGFESQPEMPNIVDWDEYDAERLVLFPCRGLRQAA